MRYDEKATGKKLKVLENYPNKLLDLYRNSINMPYLIFNWFCLIIIALKEANQRFDQSQVTCTDYTSVSSQFIK